MFQFWRSPLSNPPSGSPSGRASADLRQLQHCQRSFNLQVIRRRRRTLAIHVVRDGPVEVRAPLNCAWRDINSFIDARLDWIVNALEHLDDTPLPPAPAYVEGEYHDYLGIPRQLELVRGKPGGVILGESQLVVRCASPSDPRAVQRQLSSFFRQRALEVFASRLPACVERFRPAPSPGQLSVRKMSARWGSCSRSGDLCLNTELVQKAPETIDMVLVHELCHCFHFNHGAGFYALMDTAMPDWRDREKALKMPSWRSALT